MLNFHAVYSKTMEAIEEKLKKDLHLDSIKHKLLTDM